MLAKIKNILGTIAYWWRRFDAWFAGNAGLAVILGSLTFVRGVSYLPLFVNPDRKPAHFLEGVLPMDLNAILWISVGLMAVYPALKQGRILSVYVGIASGLHAAWGASFILNSVFGVAERAWVSAIGYIGIVWLTYWGLKRINVTRRG